jgi:hypothetical protein
MYVFFSDDVLWRNYLINRVELLEEKSIHGTISRESTFHLYFVILARLLVVLLVILRPILPIFRTFLGAILVSKKKHVHVRITTCKNITNAVIKLHAIYSRTLVNLLVKLSRTLVNLLVIPVKLTRMNPNGGHGGGAPLCPVRGIHLGEARTSDQHQIVQQWPWASAMARLLARLLVILAILARLLAILARLC